MCEKYSTRDVLRMLIQHKAKCVSLETPPECCTFRTHKHRRCFKCLLYFLAILLKAIFLSTRIASVDQTISKLLYSLFVVVEQFGRIRLASFSV